MTAALVSGSHVRVRLAKSIHPDVEYDAVVISDDGNHIVVRGPWTEEEARDLGFVRFELGDVFTEHYWRDRWYSIKEVRTDVGVLKGWYCDVARPVRVEGKRLVSEDLDLDLWVSADGRTVLRLDEDEFAASGLAETDPHAVSRARYALANLERWPARASARSIVMTDCIFCDIVAGEAPASFVHRDELVSAFLDIRPVTPGHLLVIPNEHVVFTHDLPDATADRLFTVARHLARSLRQTDAVRADGINLFVADGEAAGQEAFHAHLHVIPRYPGDGFVVDAAAWRDPPPTREELDVTAARTGEKMSDTGEPAAPRIRPIVIGVALKDDRVFAIEGFDSHKGQRFYRPPGGGIEFGETGDDALRREFREELDVELANVTYLGALENVFTYEGVPDHEIVLVHRIELVDDDRFAVETVAGAESDGTPFEARWLPLYDVRNGATRLYPDGLLDLLDLLDATGYPAAGTSTAHERI